MMKCDNCGHKSCCQPDIRCPLVIIGPGVMDGLHKEVEDKRRAEWVEMMESHVKDLLESLKRESPELFEKIVKHKPRYNIVEETISKEYDESGEL
jgi:hypothetical protein